MYHVHVIKVAGEQPIASSHLAIFFENRAFLTYNLPALLPESAAYSRRCIDDCDCVVMIVGSEYGDTNASGVSQMHLSYLTAKTKLKPILIFVKKPDSSSSRRIVDFVNLLQAQNQQYLHYYQYETVLGQHLENVYGDFEKGLTVKKWVRMDTTTPFSQKAEPTSTQNNSASSIVNLDNNRTNKNSSVSKVEDPLVNELGGPIKASTKPNRLAVKSASNADITAHTKLVTGATSAQQAMHIDNLELLLTDELVINYQAHAYQDGNLSNVNLITQLKWADVVKALTKFSSVFSTENIYRSLNELMVNYASDAVKQSMPNVHAVSRCQVCQIDFEWICSQLVYNDWMEAASHSNGSSTPNPTVSYNINNKKFWQLTSTVKQQLRFL